MAYDVTPVTIGGSGPYTWSVTGSLPAGLSIDPATGEVTGTPITSGTSSFTLVATDSVGGTATQSESVSIATAPRVTSARLGAGEVGVAYDSAPTASGGTGPYTWSVTGSLPAGLSIDPATGEVTGTPITSGRSTFRLVATDSVGGTATQSESVSIATAPRVTSARLGAGEVGVAYDSAPTASGGTGPYTWSVTGSLPAGLSIDPATGEITGTPITSGRTTFTLVATDAVGANATRAESMTVVDGPSITSPVFGAGEVGMTYHASPVVAGGTGPYTWSVTGGPLPDGLSIDSASGTVTGTPTAATTALFTLTVTDADGRSAQQAESLAIANLPRIVAPTSFPGEVGATYQLTPTVDDGTGPYTWSVVGDLPAGLTIDPATGVITGRPDAAGTNTVILRVTDAHNHTTTHRVTISIVGAPVVTGDRSITDNVGVAVEGRLAVLGGTGPYRWSTPRGALPTGVELSPHGKLSGIPADEGTFRVTVTVTDARGRTGQAQLTLVILPDGLNSRLIAVTPDGRGYWISSAAGRVTAFGSARSYGTLAGKQLSAPIAGIAATPDGRGYWLDASDGGVFAFGDAHYFGSQGGHPLNKPVVGMAATPDGRGYWLVASDGGIFCFGDAGFHGSTGAIHLNKPIVGMAATPDGHGYWLVASDGGVFSFGNAQFHGSTGAHPHQRAGRGHGRHPRRPRLLAGRLRRRHLLFRRRQVLRIRRWPSAQRPGRGHRGDTRRPRLLDGRRRRWRLQFRERRVHGLVPSGGGRRARLNLLGSPSLRANGV